MTATRSGQPAQDTPTRVIVAGAAGRMGSLACAWVEAAAGLQLGATLRRHQDAQALLADQAGAVLLDFSLHPISVALAQLAVTQGVHPVVGVSGWNETELLALEQACARVQLGALWIPNFSIGAVLQMRFAAEAAPWFPSAAVHETHPVTKLDAPSGTAKATAARMAAARPDGLAPDIEAQRGGERVAEQTVQLRDAHEGLQIQHQVDDRRAFEAGVLLACRRVRSLGGLIRGLEPLLVDGPDGLL